MSETKAKLVQQVQQLKAEIAALQAVADAAENLTWDMPKDCFTHMPSFLLHELQAALSAARFAR